MALPSRLLTYCLAIGLLVLSNCTKQKDQPTPTEGAQSTTSVDIESLKSLFTDKHYEQKLVERLNDKKSSTIYWAPQWQQATQRTSPLAVTYVYVPLQPEIDGKPFATNLVGAKKFLLIQNANQQPDFGIATYVYAKPQGVTKNISVATESTASFDSFSGTMTLKHLATNEGAYFIYKNGTLLPQTTSSTSTSKTNAYVCQNIVTCYWSGVCRDGMSTNGTITSGVDGCQPPWTEPCDDFGATWTLTYSSTTPQCHYESDPPLPGGGGTGTGPGSGPAPTFVNKMYATMTMPKQGTPGSCVPASLAQVKEALCSSKYQSVGQVEGSMIQYGIQLYGPNFINDGLPLTGIGDFINHFFNTTILYPANNYQGAINAGQPIMIDVFEYMDGPSTAVYHSVVIFGYNPNNPSQVYYLDPGTGTTKTGDGASLLNNSHYAIPITGCK
jgi:hypothetical protein